ncbi:MAG: DUF6282 family protein [Sporomusaceae bacterium]|nr:DUF6282 family protein [Sporomusaceae bacterium]
MENSVKPFSEELLQGVIDTHIHTNPDVRLRRLNDIELAREALRVGAKAIVIKSHLVPTMDRASIAEFVVPGIRVFGGLTLNSYVGGINPAAVEVAIKMGAKIIWLPTADSSHEKRLQGKSGGVTSVVDRKVTPELLAVLKLIAEHNIVLGTGHLAPEETLIVVETAKQVGVQKIIVNHPEWWSINMSLAQQKELAQYGVFFERCYATRPPGEGYRKNFAINLEAVAAIGYESTILATDGGQTENPLWSEALAEHIDFFVQSGVSRVAIDQMTKINPAKLLDLL